MHPPAGRTTRQHLFVDHIIEAHIPLGWKPLNLERYDETISPDERLDVFLTQANLYTNDMRSCVVSSQRPSRGRHWLGTVDFLHGFLIVSTLSSSASACNMKPAGPIAWHRLHWPACDKQIMNLSRNSWKNLDALSSKSTISTQR